MGASKSGKSGNMMLPILGIELNFFAKIQIFVGFKFKVSSFSLINQNFALYLQIKCESISKIDRYRR
jgi:hypothetical protein